MVPPVREEVFQQVLAADSQRVPSRRIAATYHPEKFTFSTSRITDTNGPMRFSKRHGSYEV